MRRLSVLVVALALLTGTACGSNAESRPSLGRRVPQATTTSTTLPPYVSLVATARVFILQIFDSPDAAEPSTTLGNPWLVNDDPNLPVKQVFLVTQKIGERYEVLLPVRPNGTKGWVRARDVIISQTPYRIVVELGAHRITVYSGESVLLQELVAVGKPSTPTPTGHFYLRVLLKAPDPNTVYGPYAYPLSGHSEVLTSFNGGDGELGIHGNNDESVLGQSVSAGCIRMSNAGITRLASILPLGTPVEIRP